MRPGDLAVWSMRITHSGNGMLLKDFGARTHPRTMADRARQVRPMARGGLPPAAHGRRRGRGRGVRWEHHYPSVVVKVAARSAVESPPTQTSKVEASETKSRAPTFQ